MPIISRNSRPLIRLLILVGLCLTIFITSQQEGAAMGALQEKSIRDIAIPADWTGVEGYGARDGGQPLAPGHIRIYRVGTAHRGLPQSILQQAALIRSLADLPPLAPLSDIAAIAAERGIALRDLARLHQGPGKYALPNQLLAVGAGSDHPGFFLARIALDQPNMPVAATLYCIHRQAQGADVVSISHLGGVAPNAMIKIKDKICQ